MKMAFEEKAQTSLEIREPSSRIQKVHDNGVRREPLIPCSPFRVKKLSEKAVFPSRGSSFSAGCHLFSAAAVTVPARGKALVPTDLSIGIPPMDMSIGKREGTYGRIAPLFDLFSKHIDVGAGVIDADYRGPVRVILFNHTDESFEVKAGDRIAQLILPKIAMPDVLEVDDLDLTIRDADDFNSTSSNLSFLSCTMKMALEGETQTNPEPSLRIQKTHNNIVYKDLLKPHSLLRVKKLSENAVLPSRATHLSAGYDLSSASVVTVPARGKALIPTDLGIGIPERTYAHIAPRSGLAWKHSIDVGAGVINADYRGPVRVILSNHSDKAFEVKTGDRIAQLIFEKEVMLDVLEVGDLDSIARGSLFWVRRLSENAVLPYRCSPLSAGYDLFSAAVVTVPARGKAFVPTDLSIAIPEGTYGCIAPLFDSACKSAGVIDADYRGPIKVILFNHSDEDFEVKAGDRIAQLILLEIIEAEAVEVDDLDSTVRGAGGFGSTGVGSTISLGYRWSGSCA